MSQIDTHAAPEPAATQMDGIYRYQRFIYDATRRFYLLGRDRLLADLAVPEGGKVLEIGCGTARNLIETARLYPSARLYGLDVSEEMLRTARGKIERAGMGDRIVVAAGDARAFSPAERFGRRHFDRVYISYALSMIPLWREAVACAADCVAPDGVLHVVDFGDFADYPEWMRRAQFGWLRRFSVTPIPSLERRLAEVGRSTGLAASSQRLYGGYATVVALSRPRLIS